MHVALRLALVSLTTMAVGCGGTTAPTDAGLSPVDVADPSCVPDQTVWNTTVQAQVQAQCGTCHGATPNYGAPFSLLNYAADIAGPVGRRRVDHIVSQLNAGTMPPPGTPAPVDAVAQSIVSWASCGATTATPNPGVRASAGLYISPPTAPAGLPSFELRAQNFPVTTALTETYQCYTFDVPVTTDRFIRRFEIALDHSQVVHHIVLMRDTAHTAPTTPFTCFSMPTGSDLLYAWAPGETAFQFPNGGLRASPGDRFVLQIHYNNSAGLSGFTDTTGVKIYHDAPVGTEYGMMAMGPTSINIPAHSTGSAESACTLAAGTQLLTGLPHMHTIGTGFSEHVVHADGTTDPLITVEGWQFNSQLFYDIPTTFVAGDRVITHCDYNNTRDTATTFGELTTNEMCYNFAYFTPPPATRFCDEAETAAYTPGACAVPAAPTNLPSVTGSITVGTAPTLTGGTIPTGHWVLQGVTYYISSAMTALGAVNLAQSGIQAVGQTWVQPNSIVVDMSNTLSLTLGTAAAFSHVFPLSFASTFPAMTTPLMLTTTCPAGSTSQPATLDYEVTGNTLTAGTPPQSVAGITITPQYVFSLSQ